MLSRYKKVSKHVEPIIWGRNSGSGWQTLQMLVLLFLNLFDAGVKAISPFVLFEGIKSLIAYNDDHPDNDPHIDEVYPILILGAFIAAWSVGQVMPDVRKFLTTDIKSKLSSKLNAEIYKVSMEKSLEYHRITSADTLKWYMINTTKASSDYVPAMYQTIIPAIAEALAIYTVVMVRVDPKIGALMLGSAALLFIPAVIFGSVGIPYLGIQPISKLAKNEDDSRKTSGGLLVEKLKNYESIHQFNNQKFENKKAKMILLDYKKNVDACEHAANRAELYRNLALTLSYIVTSSFAAHQYMTTDDLDYNQLILFILYLLQFAQPLNSLAAASNQLNISLAGLESCVDFIKKGGDIKEDRDTEHLQFNRDNPPSIRFENVTLFAEGAKKEDPQADICHNLLQMINNQAQCIRVLFKNYDKTVTFKAQVTTLIQLGSHLKKPAIFICKYPTAENSGTYNHYICGLIIKKNILLIDPLNVNPGEKFNKLLAKLREEKVIDKILFSSTLLQKQNPNEKLVPCGPILELAIHILGEFTLEGLYELWGKLERNELSEDGLSHRIPINDLLAKNQQLTALLDAVETKEIVDAGEEGNADEEKDEKKYKNIIYSIRQKHADLKRMLANHHAREWETTPEAYLDKCKEKSPAQVIFDLLLDEPNIDAIREGEKSHEDFQLLEHELNVHQDPIPFEGIHPILDDVTFEVEGKEMVAFVGTSGSGKSTIGNLLFRFMEPDNGCIFINNYDIAKCKVKSVRKAIGIVPQQPVLFDNSLEYNIKYGNLTREDDEDDQRFGFEEILNLTGLKDPRLKLKESVGEGGKKLSGGQQQRVAIARMLYKDAPVLFLDEITSALDNENKQKIIEILLDIMGRFTIIFVTHEINLTAIADKIFVFHNGKVVQEGTFDELTGIKKEKGKQSVKDGRFYELFKSYCKQSGRPDDEATVDEVARDLSLKYKEDKDNRIKFGLFDNVEKEKIQLSAETDASSSDDEKATVPLIKRNKDKEKVTDNKRNSYTG